MKNEKILIQININKADYKLLTKYGFMIEKNINEFLSDIANQIRQAEAEQKAEA